MEIDMTEYNSKAHLELIDKQAKLLEQMMQPTMYVTQKTLRDEYAIAALNGLLANNISVSLAVVRAVEAADLMMEKRK
jgi:hypothetical protein